MGTGSAGRGACPHFSERSQHLQELRLRDELTDEAQLPGVDAGAQASAALQFDDVYLGLGQPCRFLSKPHLHQGGHAAGLEALPADSPCKSRCFSSNVTATPRRASR